MKYVALALLLLTTAAFAHTVTLNFAARIGSDATTNSFHANSTDYNMTTPVNTNFSNITGDYISINKSTTMTAIISAGTLLSAVINNTYYHKLENSDTIMMLHLDNSTLDGGPYGNNATSQNGVDCSSTVVGKLNTACSFDGLNDYINRSILAPLEGQSYTVSLWVLTSAAGAGIFSQANGSSHRMEIYLSSGQPTFFTFEGGSATLSYASAINDGQWHHIAVTKSGSTGRLYVDGLLRQSGTIATVSSTNELRIGSRYDGSSPLGGRIDEVVVYNKTLTDGEVHDLYLFSPRYVLAKMKQDSADNRFLIGFTNGTYGDIDNKTESIRKARMVGSTIGRFFVKAPESFPIFIRLEYQDIDIQNAITWSGIGKLIVTNRGNTERNIPNVTLELIR